jgi:hypothetical protein
MIERRSTMLPPPSVPDEEEIYLAELTPLENLAVCEYAAADDYPTIPAPPPEHY